MRHNASLEKILIFLHIEAGDKDKKGKRKKIYEIILFPKIPVFRISFRFYYCPCCYNVRIGNTPDVKRGFGDLRLGGHFHR